MIIRRGDRTNTKMKKRLQNNLEEQKEKLKIVILDINYYQKILDNNVCRDSELGRDIKLTL